MAKRNPVAVLLKAGIFQLKVLKAKKGKGSYRRIKVDKRSDQVSLDEAELT